MPEVTSVTSARSPFHPLLNSLTLAANATKHTPSLFDLLLMPAIV